MDEPKKNTQSLWKKTWQGPRLFLFFLLIVSIAVFVLALCVVAITFAGTPLLDKYEGAGYRVWYMLWIMAGFIVSVALVFCV